MRLLIMNHVTPPMRHHHPQQIDLNSPGQTLTSSHFSSVSILWGVSVGLGIATLITTPSWSYAQNNPTPILPTQPITPRDAVKEPILPSVPSPRPVNIPRNIPGNVPVVVPPAPQPPKLPTPTLPTLPTTPPMNRIDRDGRISTVILENGRL